MYGRIPGKSEIILLFLGFFLLLACNKEDTISLPLTELASPTSSRLNAIHFTDAQTGFAVGGDSWYRGIALKTTDGGSSWTVDSIASAELFSLQFLDNRRGFTTGIGGRFLQMILPDQLWQFGQFLPWHLHRDICFFDVDHGIVVGGESYGDGQIVRLGKNFERLSVDSFANELSTVCYSDSSTVHVAGYGLLLRSTDGGIRWQQLDVDGDFFQDIFFVDSQTGYLVGLAGAIYKTTDGGARWHRVRAAKILSDTGFRAIHFSTSDKGYLVGKAGTFWRTLDGGESWQMIKGLPDIDLRDVYFADGQGFIVGEGGRIFRFED